MSYASTTLNMSGSILQRLAESPTAHLWMTYGWLLISAGALASLVLLLWAIFMHRTYRSKWRTFDILLNGLLVQELPVAILLAALGAIKSSLVHLPRQALETRVLLTRLALWSSGASRFYQLTILAALLADRAFILRWPYRYRFAVRHTQIRLFLLGLAVLASASGFVSIVGQRDPSLAEFLHSQSHSGANFTEVSPFTFDPSTLQQQFSVSIFGVYVFLVVISAVCALYVECKRPKRSSSLSSTSNVAGVKGQQSVSTLFTTTTTSSTTSSSLDNSSPLPSRFSSLANLTSPVSGSVAHQQQKSTTTTSGSSPQSSLPSFYFPNRNSTKNGDQQQQAQQMYPISIVDMQGVTSCDATSPMGFPSMSTDNSFYRLIENSSNSPVTTLNHHHHLNSVHDVKCSSNDPTSSLDPLHPTFSSSFKSHHMKNASLTSAHQLLNASNSPDSSSSPFDLRWSSALGPATFCFAFNHGPFLVFTAFGLLIPEFWTPFHDLILAGLSLTEALLLPLILCLSDSHFRAALKKNCCCGSSSSTSSKRRLVLSGASDKVSCSSLQHPTTTTSAISGKSIAEHRPLSGFLANYSSEIDLSPIEKKGEVKLHRIGYVKHNDNLSSSSRLHHSSMLDLSIGGAARPTPRSRHSLALLSHLPTSNSTSGFGERSSFRKRPPSVASYHHLFTSNALSSSSSSSRQSSHLQRCPPQYMFGAKSEINLLSASPNYFNLNESPIKSTNLCRQYSSIQKTELPELPTNSGSSNSNLLRNFKQKDQTGIGARSSFKRRSNIRKSGSDASAFYNRNRNLMKRSQIAQNQLSSILYNNFCSKKFGSQTTLLEDSTLASPESEHPNVSFGTPQHSQAQHQLSSRHLSYDFSQQSPISGSHVYLPNPTILAANHRSNSCQALSGDSSQYHNHLLLHKTAKFKDRSAILDDEPIYASLPEEEEEDLSIIVNGNRRSYAGVSNEHQQHPLMDSFSAQSTLQDNCHLLTFTNLPTTAAAATTAGGSSTAHFNSALKCDVALRNDTHNEDDNDDEIDETIYEEVSSLFMTPTKSSCSDSGNKPKRSVSQDTLTMEDFDRDEDGDETRDCHSQKTPTRKCRSQDEEDVEDDDDDDDDDDEDDDDGVDEDGISILSDASSSTFSSFTTCANQDFDFIANDGHNRSTRNKQKRGRNSMEQSGDTNSSESNRMFEDDDDDDEEEESVDMSPSTLSAAALFYNKVLLNDPTKQSKLCHRQRSKVNRRQSFSTAYELRQRILQEDVPPIAQQLPETSRGMNILVEEDEPEEIHQHPLGYFEDSITDFRSGFSKRFSTSEDNLLSIISTDGAVIFDDRQRAPISKLTKNSNLVTRVSNTPSSPKKASSNRNNPSNNHTKNISIAELKSKRTKAKSKVPVVVSPAAGQFGSIWDQKSSQKSSPTKTVVPQSSTRVPSFVSALTPSSTTTSSSSSSSSASPSHRGFQSKLPTNKQSSSKPSAATGRQNARQNAIHAKNALMMTP